MRFHSRVLCLLALAAPLFAGEAPVNAVRPIVPLDEAQSRELLERLRREGRAVVAIRAGFTQTTESPLLAAPEVRTGTLLFRKTPLAFRYEYAGGRLFALEDGTLRYWLPEQRQAGRLDVRRYESKFSKYADPLNFTEKLGTDFVLAGATRSGAVYALEIVPGPKRKRIPLQKITLRFIDPGADGPLRLGWFSIEMKSGEKLSFEFAAPELNPPLQAGSFSVKIPPGVPIRESLPDGVSF